QAPCHPERSEDLGPWAETEIPRRLPPSFARRCLLPRVFRWCRLAPRNDMAKQERHTKAVRRWRLAILLSGRGSNFEAIADAAAEGRIPNTEIVAVISDVPDAKGLWRARERGLPVFSVDRRRFSSRSEHEDAIAEILDAAKPDLICLAGYMRLLSAQFVGRYR